MSHTVLDPWSRLLPPLPTRLTWVVQPWWLIADLCMKRGLCWGLAEQQDARGIMPTIPYYATVRGQHGKDYLYQVWRADCLRGADGHCAAF